MTRLYDLAAAYKTIADLIDHDDDNDWAPALETLTGSIEDKCQNIAGLIRSLEAESVSCEVESARLLTKAKVNRNAASRLKDYLKANLEAAGLDKVKAGVFTVALQASPPSCQVEDESLVPTIYKRLIPERWEIDKRAIVDAWKAGVEVAGAVIRQSRHLRIR